MCLSIRFNYVMDSNHAKGFLHYRFDDEKIYLYIYMFEDQPSCLDKNDFIYVMFDFERIYVYHDFRKYKYVHVKGFY